MRQIQHERLSKDAQSEGAHLAQVPAKLNQHTPRQVELVPFSDYFTVALVSLFDHFDVLLVLFLRHFIVALVLFLATILVKLLQIT